MPRGVAKGGSLAKALRNEIQSSFRSALAASGLASSKDIKQLTKAVRTLSTVMKKSPAAPGRKAAAASGSKKRGRKPKATVCKIRGCNRKHYAKGLCASHYNTQLRRKKMAALKSKKAANAFDKNSCFGYHKDLL